MLKTDFQLSFVEEPITCLFDLSMDQKQIITELVNLQHIYFSPEEYACWVTVCWVELAYW